MGDLKSTPWQAAQLYLATAALPASTSPARALTETADTANAAAIIRSFFIPDSLFLLGVIGRNIGNVLIRQRACNAAHRRMLAIALLVFMQRVFEILLRLAA